MYTRVLVVAVAVLVCGLVAGAVVTAVLVPNARAAILACDTPEACARAWDNRWSVQKVEFIVAGIAALGAILLLPGLALDEPLPASLRQRFEPPVSWTWRRWKLGPEVRIPLLLVPIVAIAIAAQSPWVFALSLPAFLAPVALRRRSLSPGLIHRSFLLGLGVGAYSAGFAVGGLWGVLCVAFLGLTAIGIAFVAMPKL